MGNCLTWYLQTLKNKIKLKSLKTDVTKKRTFWKVCVQSYKPSQCHSSITTQMKQKHTLIGLILNLNKVKLLTLSRCSQTKQKKFVA